MTDEPRILGPDGITVIGQTRATRGHEFKVKSVFDLSTGRAVTVLKLPGVDQGFGMHPAEARILGMQLICEAERGVADAIAMRMLLEAIGMDKADAAQLWRSISAGTRADHAAAYERSLKADQQAEEVKAVQPEDTDGSSPAH